MDRQPSTPAVLAFVTLGYAVLGLLGLALAIPPGYASPIYPAAGLALAAALRWGWRALPGVWAGAFLANAVHAVLTERLGPVSIAAAAWIGVGAAFQAGLGRALVARFVGPAWERLERERDAVGFLLSGGALAGLASATLATFGLLYLGVIGRPEVPYNWWTWYVGDVLGIMVFAPLGIAGTAGADPLWRYRRRRVTMPTLLALGLAAVAFHQASGWEMEMQRTRLAEDGQVVAQLLSDRLIAHREILASLRNYVEATPEVEFARFEQFTRLTLGENGDLFALSVNDVVPASARASHEEALSSRSPLGAYRITERDAAGKLVPAGDRAEYVAVRYIVPVARNEKAVGFDIQSEPVRRAAIARAREAGAMAVTAPIRLVQEREERIGLLELMPVARASGPAPAGGAGFVVAVVKVDEMIAIATRNRLPPGLVFQLSDAAVAGEGGLLHRSPGWAEAQRGARRDGAEWSGTLRAGGRDWTLGVVIDERHRQAHRTWAAWAIGVVGILFAALFQILSLATTGRAAVIERKNEELRASEERYQRLFDESPLPKWVLDAADLRFLMVNERAVALYGWSREEFLRMHLADVLPPGEEVTAGLPLTADRVREVRHMRRDGTLIQVVVRTSPIRLGDAQARLEVLQDVTREREVQARLQLADQFVENSGTSIVVTDPDAVVLSVNPAFTRTTGYAPAEIVGRNIRVLNSGRHPVEFFREMWRRLLEEGAWQGEVWNRRKDGTVFLEALNISAVRDEGGRTTQYVASFLDITGQRALEEKLARASRLAALGTLVTGVAHEVNNPLTGVMGAQGTALEIVGELDEQRAATGRVDPALAAAALRDVRETLADAQASAARIARIVRDLTILGRSEAPRGRVRLADVVDEALRWMPASVLRGVTVRVEDGGPPDVEGSEGQLVQVLVNLVTNAAKAAPSGGEGQVVVRTGPGEPGRAVLEVQDDGCGMAPDLVERIFDPFFTTRKAGEGSGLGLPICNSIVSAHGGTISVTSAPGKGSTFRVDLPAAEG